jgi:hypothetical protein
MEVGLYDGFGSCGEVVLKTRRRRRRREGGPEGVE